jgi:3-hydroxyacyl-[acyl-carrier-protein] dehydratase
VRFELIDQVVERHPDRLVALKNVTCAEEYLADHFPGFPVLPGVMMLETLVQAARRLLELADPTMAPLVLAEVRNVRYGNMVRPGECLKVDVTLKSHDPKLGWEFSGIGTVNEQMAVQGKFRLAVLE